MQNREVYLADIKTRQDEYKASKAAATTTTTTSAAPAAPKAKVGGFTF
jgi:hypothetical protein